MSTEPPPDLDDEWVELRRYGELTAARAAVLPLAARELPYEVARDGREWIVKVELRRAAEAHTELKQYEQEQREARAAAPEEAASGPISIPALVAVAALFLGAFALQERFGTRAVEAGVADSLRILQGEWWRTVTALCLHADSGHLAANLGSGLLFAALLTPQVGVGVAGLLVLVSGAVANALNAWGHRTQQHLSVGASTAVFAALGLLVGLALADRTRHPGVRRWLVPIGTGLALLAYLGVGEGHDRVDYMAHLWGLVVGTVVGFSSAGPALRAARHPGWQWLSGLLAAVLLIGAWALAWQAPH